MNTVPSLLLFLQQPQVECLFLVNKDDMSWLSTATLNTVYVPTEIKPLVMWIKKKSTACTLALIASVRCITGNAEFAGRCESLSGTAAQQKVEASSSGCGCYFQLGIGREKAHSGYTVMVLNISTASGFSSALWTFQNVSLI